MSQEFRFLFSPLRVGPVTLRNRIVSTAHGTGFAKSNLPSDVDLYYHREKAKGGVGLTIMGVIQVHPSASLGLGGTDVWGYDDRITPWYQRISSAVHEFGAKMFVELSHCGRQGVSTSERGPLLAPSAIRPPERYFETPRELEVEEIAEIVEAFGQAAGRAREGGMDGVELHGAHGNLIAQFLSPFSNKRTDGYGGSLENRLHFPLEVIDSVRRHAGDDFVLGIRISGDELVDGGLTLDDMQVIAQRLEASGKLDFLDVSASTYSDSLANALHMPPMAVPTGSLEYLAAGIKQVVNLPILCVGRVNDPTQAEKILADGHADLVGMTRAILCDSELPNKAREGRLEDIRTCIACNEGCSWHVNVGRPITCIQNPVVGREKEWAEIEPARSRKRVVVVGGGPAGLEAARVAALRGHEVTLFEREERLGGQVMIAAKAPYRETFGEIERYLSRQVEKVGVDVRLGVSATVESIREMKADAVIVATGSIPLKPSIAGVEGENVVTDWEVLEGKVEVGERVIILDEEGRVRASSVAEHLADRGKKVEILTSLAYVGMDTEPKTWRLLYQRLLEKGVTPTPHTRVKEIRGNAIGAYNTITNVERVMEGVDTVVLSLGGEANNGLYRGLKGEVKELYAVGDCAAPRMVEQAIYEGHKAALAL